jgi:hypothetical protein
MSLQNLSGVKKVLFHEIQPLPYSLHKRLGWILAANITMHAVLICYEKS